MSEHYFTPTLRTPPPSVERGGSIETPEMLAEARARDRELYDYMVEYFGVTEGGDLIVKKQRKNGKQVGSVLGSDNGDGYLITRVLGKKRKNHHLIWLMYFGRLPRAGLMTDHVDQCRTNNRIENLRESTNQFNCLNRKGSDNTLPHGLIRITKNCGRYHYIWARIRHPSTCESLGKLVRVTPWAKSADGTDALGPDALPIRAEDEELAINIASAWWQATQQALYGQAA